MHPSMHPYPLLPIGLSQPICQIFQHQAGTIRLTCPFSQAHPCLQNTAQYDAYLNTICIYIRLPERFYNAFLKFSPIDARYHMIFANGACLLVERIGICEASRGMIQYRNLPIAFWKFEVIT
jgi:hypothetical protein